MSPRRCPGGYTSARCVRPAGMITSVSEFAGVWSQILPPTIGFNVAALRFVYVPAPPPPPPGPRAQTPAQSLPSLQTQRILLRDKPRKGVYFQGSRWGFTLRFAVDKLSSEGGGEYMSHTRRTYACSNHPAQYHMAPIGHSLHLGICPISNLKFRQPSSIDSPEKLFQWSTPQNGHLNIHLCAESRYISVCVRNWHLPNT